MTKENTMYAQDIQINDTVKFEGKESIELKVVSIKETKCFMVLTSEEGIIKRVKKDKKVKIVRANKGYELVKPNQINKGDIISCFNDINYEDKEVSMVLEEDDMIHLYFTDGTQSWYSLDKYHLEVKIKEETEAIAKEFDELMEILSEETEKEPTELNTTEIITDDKSSLKEEAYELSELEQLSEQEISNILANKTCPLWFIENILSKKECENYQYRLKTIVQNHNIKDLALEKIALAWIEFTQGDFNFAIFNQSLIKSSFFDDCDFNDTTFVDTKIINTVFSESEILRTTFTNCIIQGVDFLNCDVSYVTFDSCKFIGDTLDGSIFKKVTFNNCIIKDIDWGTLSDISDEIEII